MEKEKTTLNLVIISIFNFFFRFVYNFEEAKSTITSSQVILLSKLKNQIKIPSNNILTFK